MVSEIISLLLLEQGGACLGASRRVSHKCSRMCFIIRNNILYGLGVGILTVSEILCLLEVKGVGHAWARTRRLPGQCH